MILQPIEVTVKDTDEFKKLIARNKKLEKRYKTLKDKNADKGRKIKKLKQLLSESLIMLPFTNCGELRFHIREALK